jgi:hypothetical protein
LKQALSEFCGIKNYSVQINVIKFLLYEDRLRQGKKGASERGPYMEEGSTEYYVVFTT